MQSEHAAPAKYEVYDDAPSTAQWITMVHGVSQDRSVFSGQVARFRSDYRLILIDLPGHGLSSDMPGPYGLEEYAGAIGAALAEADVKASHLWGTHLGAGAGLILACQAPDKFRSLILESPVFPGHPLPAVNLMLSEVIRVAREDGMSAAREKWWQEGGWFDVMRANPTECRAAEQRAIVGNFGGKPWLDSGLASRPISPIDDLIPRLDLPVLLMNGEHEMEDFVEASDKLEALFPICERAWVEGGGGFPLWEFPDRVNERVLRFLKTFK